MPNYEKIAEAKARKYGLDPVIFKRQIRAESRFNPKARSPAGALGIAQIMPATARAWKVNPLDPEAALDAAARNMASYVRKHGSYENALRAYNAGEGAIEESKGYAETNNYVAKILGGKEPESTPTATSSSRRTRTVPEKVDTKEALVQAMLRGGYGAKKGLLERAQGIIASGEVTIPAHTVEEAAVKSHTGHDHGPAQPVKAGGAYAGTEGVAKTAREIARGMDVPVTSSKRPRRNTATGDMSDHYVGNKTAWADDYGATGQKGLTLAKRIARAYGVPFKEDSYDSGGVVTIDGKRYRVQILFGRGGKVNHADHVHVGIKRL